MQNLPLSLWLFVVYRIILSTTAGGHDLKGSLDI